MLEIKVLEQKIETITPADHTRGTIGAKVRIVFDDFWTNYEKTVVFERCYSSITDKPVNVLVGAMDVTVDIPPEMLAEYGKYKIGVFGTKDNTVLPTLYSEEFNSLYATNTKGGKAPDTYTPSELEQLRQIKQDKLTPGKGIIIDDNNVISVNATITEETLENKVDKIDYTKKETAQNNDWGYDIGVHGVKANNTPALFHATKAATANTVAVRDGNGSISVSIGIKDEDGKNYVGGAAPHTWVTDCLNALNERLYEFRTNESNIRANADNNLQTQVDNLRAVDTETNNKIANGSTELELVKSVAEGKKITKYTIAAGGSLILKKNAAYILLGDGSDNTVSIYNNGAVQYEGTDNELTMQVGIIIIPDNTMGASAEYPPSYYSLAIKISSGSSILGIPDVNSAKFSVLKKVMESGGLVAKENSGSSTVSVWEIAL